MTSLLNGFVAVLIAGALNALVVGWVKSTRRGSDGSFLTRVYTATLLLRFCLAVVLNVFASDSSFAGVFWGDSGTYDAGGDLLARSWKGEAAGTPLVNAVSGWGFVYVVGGLYFVFGRNQLLVQLLNCTVGAITVLAVYAIAARLFGREVGRWAALFMAFFPQMIFWSAGMYKDPMVLLCIAVCMYAVLRLKESFSAPMVLLFVGAALALLTLRFYIFYFVAAAALGTFVFGQKGDMVQRLASYAVLVGVLAGAFTLGVKQETLEVQAAYMTLSQLQVTRADQATWSQSAYGAEQDVTTTSGALRALPIGLVYLLFAPFPWAISGVRQLLTLPETLVWYGLMPSFGIGLAHAIRHRLRDILPILVFTVTLTLAYALMQGNVGTAYRQRTQISMFFFVFMGVGLELRRQRRMVGVRSGLPGARPAGHTTEGTSDPVEDKDFVVVSPSVESDIQERAGAAGGTARPERVTIKDDDFVHSEDGEGPVDSPARNGLPRGRQT